MKKVMGGERRGAGLGVVEGDEVEKVFKVFPLCVDAAAAFSFSLEMNSKALPCFTLQGTEVKL